VVRRSHRGAASAWRQPSGNGHREFPHRPGAWCLSGDHRAGPQQPQPAGGRWFGIDRLTAPRIVTWAIRTADIDGSVAAAKALGYDPGQPTSMSRQTDAGAVLQWRLTPPQIDLNDGLVPFLIDWGSTPHPTSRDPPQTRLTSWAAIHPAPEIVQRRLAALGCQLHIAAGDRPALTAMIEGHRGLVTLS
jgi:hypothetical protein